MKRSSLTINQPAFTLIEVMIALAVTLIALIPLLHLLTSSILTTNTAQNLSTATLIANSKLAELTAQSDPESTLLSETIETPNTQTLFQCSTQITHTKLPDLNESSQSSLRKASVTISWDEGKKQKQTELTKYIFMDQLATKSSKD